MILKTIFHFKLELSEPEPNSHGRNCAHALLLPVIAMLLAGCDPASPLNMPRANAALAEPKLQDETLLRGLGFSHLQGEDALTGLHETLGAGACAFDYDTDGWTDLFVVNGSGLTRFYGQQHWWNLQRGHALFRNEGGHFVDVTDAAGLESVDWGMGCASADLDNDGDRDLFIANYGPNRLYRNNGDGTFSDITKSSGIKGSRWSTGAAIADYDGDGFADIYVVNYIDFEPGAHTFEDRQQFTREMSRAFRPEFFTSISNKLYRNRGDWTFEDVTEAAGITDAGGRGLMAQWLDIDGDAQLDLLIANDTASPLGLYLNRDGRFIAGGERFQLNTAAGVRGIAVDDFDNNGHIDLGIGTGDGRPPVLLAQQPDMEESERFVDVAWQRFAQSRHAATGSTYGLAMEDFNADGYVDLFLANGFVGLDQDVSRLPQGQRSSLLAGGPNRFTAVDNLPDPGVQSARAVIASDFNNDGLPDLYITHNNDIGQLLINRSQDTGETLSIELADKQSVQGAVVTLSAGDMTRARLYGAGTLFGNSSERLHFGLGKSQVADIKVRWPDGEVDIFENAAAGHHYRITRNDFTQVDLPQPKDDVARIPRVIGTDRPEHRAAYLEWRLAEGSDAERERLFEAALADPSAKVRLTALAAAAATPRQYWLAGTLFVLDHPDRNTRLAALETVERFEAESSVRWLLLRLNDQDAEVRARAADVFRYWFSEDEAVTQRKYLALPGLIRLLHDSNEKVRLAAIRALGEAEPYRAIQPLLQLLDDDSAKIRSNAAWALGRIREREVIGPLITRLGDADEAPPVRASAIIALQRLASNDPLERFATIETRSQPRLEVLIALLNDPDRAVIDRENITRLLQKIFNEEGGIDRHPSTAQLFIQASCANGDAAAATLLDALLENSVTATRVKAWQCLFDLMPESAAAHWHEASQDPASPVRLAALRKLIETGKASRAILADASDDSALRETALLARLQNGDAAAALALLQDTAALPEGGGSQRSVLTALGNSKAGTKKAAAFLAHGSEDVRAAALRLWSRSLPIFIEGVLPEELRTALNDPALPVRQAAADVLLKRQEAWATETLETLLDADDAIAVQRRIVDRAWQRSGDTGVALLRPILQIKDHPLRRAAIAALCRIDSPAASKLLYALMRDEKNPADLRFAAARSLWKREPDRVFGMLQTMGDNQ